MRYEQVHRCAVGPRLATSFLHRVPGGCKSADLLSDPPFMPRIQEANARTMLKVSAGELVRCPVINGCRRVNEELNEHAADEVAERVPAVAIQER